MGDGGLMLTMVRLQAEDTFVRQWSTLLLILFAVGRFYSGVLPRSIYSDFEDGQDGHFPVATLVDAGSPSVQAESEDQSPSLPESLLSEYRLSPFWLSDTDVLHSQDSTRASALDYWFISSLPPPSNSFGLS
jgi:hypothetical protein